MPSLLSRPGGGSPASPPPRAAARGLPGAWRRRAERSPGCSPPTAGGDFRRGPGRPRHTVLPRPCRGHFWSRLYCKQLTFLPKRSRKSGERLLSAGSGPDLDPDSAKQGLGGPGSPTSPGLASPT